MKRSNKLVTLNPSCLRDVLQYIEGLAKIDRRRELGDNKFYFLSDVGSVPDQPDAQTLVFKFASHGQIPPLLNRETLEERDNPRGLQEGERGRTHAVIRYFDDEAIVLLEETRPGVTIDRIERYLINYADAMFKAQGKERNYNLESSVIPKKNFLEELRKLKRVTVGSVFISKQWLGSDYLNFSNRLQNVRRDIRVLIPAEKGRSIETLVEDLFQGYVSDNEKIRRIRVQGLSEEDRMVTLDTKLIQMFEFLNFEANVLTGEIRTHEILRELGSMIAALPEDF
ncbi:MAG TPA: hypothetical protein V6D06_14855 [Trichocoleus sp.]